MRVCSVGLAVAVALSAGACAGSSPTAASPATTVIVADAQAAPAGLPGWVIDTGVNGVSAVPLTCSDIECVESIQLQNMGPGCAANVDGSINVFSAPASTTSLTSSRAGLLIPSNPVLVPGQSVTVNVSVPNPAGRPDGYVVTVVLSWTNHACS